MENLTSKTRRTSAKAFQLGIDINNKNRDTLIKDIHYLILK